MSESVNVKRMVAVDSIVTQLRKQRTRVGRSYTISEKALVKLLEVAYDSGVADISALF